MIDFIAFDILSVVGYLQQMAELLIEWLMWTFTVLAFHVLIATSKAVIWHATEQTLAFSTGLQSKLAIRR